MTLRPALLLTAALISGAAFLCPVSAAPTITGAPSGEQIVAVMLARLGADAANVTVRFESGLIDGRYCATAHPLTRVILASGDPQCLWDLLRLLAHEVGHLTPPCRELMLAGAESARVEACAEDYRRARGL